MAYYISMRNNETDEVRLFLVYADSLTPDEAEEAFVQPGFVILEFEHITEERANELYAIMLEEFQEVEVQCDCEQCKLLAQEDQAAIEEARFYNILSDGGVLNMFDEEEK